MRQVLFTIPVPWGDLPIYGYGFMLFLAFVGCTWLAARLAAREGIARESIQDLAIWLFVTGIVGARVTFMIQYWNTQSDWLFAFFRIWEGGLVFYGSAIGGVVGYFLAYYFVLRKYKVSHWKMADIVAPCVALGLCLGRVGCLLNGCCYGDVACPDCPQINYPLSSQLRFVTVDRGYSTVAGFTFTSDEQPTVGAVEPGSPADRAKLRPGDIIKKVNGTAVFTAFDVYKELKQDLHGKNDLVLTVERGRDVVTLPAFEPWTIGLHPTQLYETISMALVLWLLLAFFPYRRKDGQVMVLFMYCYALHRFFDERLRNDTDPVAFGLTLSQNISIAVLAAAVVLSLILWRRPVQYPRKPDAFHLAGGSPRLEEAITAARPGQ
jgi:phosphatidylglycerol:prolipoprotein diacylglycerol transferase